MNRTAFVPTLKAFSIKAAIFAAAALLACANFSCSNLGGGADYSQAQNSMVANLPAGKARVCGTIDGADSMSRSVVPTKSDVTGDVASYDVYAWGTKADGTSVPKGSPIHGTVTTSGGSVTFSIDLDYGSWYVRAEALDSSGNPILCKTSPLLTLNDSNPVANISLGVGYAQDAGTGKLALALSFASAINVKTISYSLTGPSGTISDTIDVSGATSCAFDESNIPSLGALDPGQYNLVLEFKNGHGILLARVEQTVHIYSNVTTNKVLGSSSYISSGNINITSAVAQSFLQSSIYIGGTGTGTSIDANDTNNGTQYDPIASLKRAFEIINNSSLTPTDGFKIFVQTDLELEENIDITTGQKITIYGTKRGGDPYTISGDNGTSAPTYSITAGGDSFDCSCIHFDKINGFEITSGQAKFYACKITNGTSPAGEGGGGLCVDAGGVKASLTNCVISGCHTSNNGGAIYVGNSSEVTLADCVIGQDSSSCATSTLYSNVADQGGGIAVQGGTLIAKNTKILYNAATGGTESDGGGIYDVAGTVTITGGQINHNYADKFGGGIFHMGNITINDCVIGQPGANSHATSSSNGHGNQASQGGGIYSSAGTVNSTNGFSVLKNYSSLYGGGIYSAVTIELKKCDVSYNASGSYGGGIYSKKNTVSLKEGTAVNFNHSDNNGGGVAMHNTDGAAVCRLLMSDSATMNGNTTDESGAGLYLYNAGLTMSDSSEMKGNKATQWAGGIYMEQANSSLTIQDNANIEGNEGTDGGGINAIGGTVEMSGGTIKGNKGTDGGGIRLFGSVVFKMTGGEISGNSATGNGGGVAVMKDATFVIGGSAYIPAGTDKKNDVYLFADDTGVNRTISLASSLTATETPVATIKPASYGSGKTVIDLASGSSVTGAGLSVELAKFKVKDDSTGESWTIGKSSAGTEGVLTAANIYVDGDVTGTELGTASDPCKTVGAALTKVLAPNCNIIMLGDTNETEPLTIEDADKMTGLTIKSAGATQKTITSTNHKPISVGVACLFDNLLFSGWDGMSVDSGSSILKLNKIVFEDCHTSSGSTCQGGALFIMGGTVEAFDLQIKDCYVTGLASAGGGAYIAYGATLNVDGLVMQNCYAEGSGADGGGICNDSGTVILKDASILSCVAEGNGNAIYNANGGKLVLDGATKIDSDIYLVGGDSSDPALPIYVKEGFALASGASIISVGAQERTGAGEQFQENDALVQGYDDGTTAHNITPAQCAAFALPGSKYSVEYDDTGAVPVGKLVDKSIAGGVTVSIGGNISFEIATPTASGNKAKFNVVDNSSGTPAYVTPTSSKIAILQYGATVYSANAQEVTATYLTPGKYELYCMAVIGGVTYDTTIPFAAGAKYTPLTLEAAVAGAVVTFDNKASGNVTYKVNGGTEQTIAAGTTETITLNNAGDKVQFFGINTHYATHDGSSSYNVANYTGTNIACSADCYLYGNIMSLVNPTGYSSATSLTSPCAFAGLFMGNTHIKNKENIGLALPATTLSDDCYTGLFYGCTSLTSAPELPATTLEDRCYLAMFSGCASLTSAPALPAMALDVACYQYMFKDCTSLMMAPTLPATTLAAYCYNGMFYGCTSLTAAPALPAMTLGDYCYAGMFHGCASLTAAPALPATTLKVYCYNAMFYHCTSLVTAPELPATVMVTYCYDFMFNGCANLTSAPALPATTLAESCYEGMFLDCASLTSAPALPATTLAKTCYQAMFTNCTSLTAAPYLPAETLEEWSYRQMFQGCSSLSSVTCLATSIRSGSYVYTYGWLDGVAATGTFTKAAGMTDWSRDAHGIPDGWTVQNAP